MDQAENELHQVKQEQIRPVFRGNLATWRLGKESFQGGSEKYDDSSMLPFLWGYIVI